MILRRVHITGASASGTTTLGRALASEWSVPCHDTDDFYWYPTDPPYQDKRPEDERLDLMQAMFLPRPAWILTGSLMGWGNPLIPMFDMVVFLTLEPEIRLARLAAREAMRYDAALLVPGGPLHEAHETFLRWARRYDDPTFTGRSRKRHEEWLSNLPCPVLHLDSSAPVEALVAAVCAHPAARA
jgi:adenylate kinase family enzyme